ncbi:MAG TPA: thiamine phosphate synthase, partial [Pyrinomonadaceae bacterium]
MKFELPKLYPITDRRLSGLTHAEQVARLCEGGARVVQLREKHLPAREFYAEVVEALKVARSFGAKLIVNDRADVALAAGADGVHVGQDDMPPEAVRALLGEGKTVGFSTHSVGQSSEA